MKYTFFSIFLALGFISMTVISAEEYQNDSKRIVKNNEKKETKPEYVQYPSFGDFFYDEGANDSATELG